MTRHRHTWGRPPRPVLCVKYACVCGRTKWPVPNTNSSWRPERVRTFYRGGNMRDVERFGHR